MNLSTTCNYMVNTIKIQIIVIEKIDFTVKERDLPTSFKHTYLCILKNNLSLKTTINVPKSNSLSESERSQTVSYTHLDVYKRQVLIQILSLHVLVKSS